LKITDGALRLFLRIVEAVDGAAAGRPFQFSHRTAAALCGITDKATLYRRLKQLCPGYLKSLGVKGCPPTAWYRINL
jgi:hypothetical protein